MADFTPVTNAITGLATAVDAAVADIGNQTPNQTQIQAAADAISAEAAKLTAALPQPIVAAAPVVSGVSPANGPAAGGTPVTVSGTGFTGATSVVFGSSTASNLVVVSDTEITVDTPADAAGTQDVAVTTPAGVSPLGVTFTYE